MVNTYYDKKFDLSFQYENGWVVSEALDPGYRGIRIYNYFSKEEVMINKSENPESLNPRQWLQNLKGKKYHSELFQPIEDFQVNGKQALVAGQPDTCDTAQMLVAFIKTDNNIFEITELTYPDTPKQANMLKKIVQSLNIGKKINTFTELSEDLFTYPQSPTDYTCNIQQ